METSLGIVILLICWFFRKNALNLNIKLCSLHVWRCFGNYLAVIWLLTLVKMGILRKIYERWYLGFKLAGNVVFKANHFMPFCWLAASKLNVSGCCSWEQSFLWLFLSKQWLNCSFMLPGEKKRGGKSSFVNKLSGEALQLALLTFCSQNVNTSFLLPNSEVHSNIARRNCFIFYFKYSWETQL